MKTLKTLNGVTRGVYKIITKSGTIYVLDLNNNTSTRFPPNEEINLMGDKIPLPFQEVNCIETQSMFFDTGAVSTPVVSIKKVFQSE